jgi:hypothetical protein
MVCRARSGNDNNLQRAWHQQRVSGPHGFAVRAPVSAKGLLRRGMPAKIPARTVEALLVLRAGLAHEAAFNGPPCETSARATLPRPPHSTPTSVTIAIRPSGGMERAICTGDLGSSRSGIFLREGLDAERRGNVEVICPSGSHGRGETGRDHVHFSAPSTLMFQASRARRTT